MHPITQKITSLHRQLTWRRRATAACWIVAALVAAALVLGLADYLLRFNDRGLRIMATSALAGVATIVAYRAWYLPSRRQLQPLGVARQVEKHFPQLQDSLASAVEFLGQSEEDQLAGSAQLRRLVVAEAENTVESLPLEEVIDRRPLRWSAAALGVAAVVALLCLLLDAAAVRTALARLVAPLGSAQWPRQHHLQFREVPKLLAAGQTFEVELINTAGPLPDEVRCEFGIARDGGREVTSEPMTRAGEVMVARRENVQQSFGFRAEGGDDDTMPWHWVEVVEPPKLDALKITVHPPAYTGLPAAPAERHLKVLAGTGIEVSGSSSKPLKSARILQDGVPPIDATLVADSTGKERRAFHITSQEWLATKSGPYRLELNNDDGVGGVVGQWNLHVEPDAPPSVSWQQPADDMYVLPRAIIPVELLVKDDVAIQQVNLMYERSDRSESERNAHPTEPPISLFRGPKKPTPAANDAATGGENRVVEYNWELAPLQMPAGAQLTVNAEASDYRPGTGRAAGPRHISIITPDELEARLADRQTQIVRQLERALAIEQTTREDVRRLEIQQHDAGVLAKGDVNTLQTAELNQRRVGRMLVDPAEGVPPLVDAILAEIEINQLASSPIRDSMEHLAAELDRLSREPLGSAERELTSARKAIETLRLDDAGQAALVADAKNAEMILQSLQVVGLAQDDVIATVERLVNELSGKGDYRRIARLLAELRQEQIAHEKSVRSEIGLETLPLQASELSRTQRANLNKAAAGEESIAGRYDKIEQGMDQLARQLADDNDSMAGTLTDAVDLARQLSIGLDMRQTTGDLRENRVGRALERESHIAGSLQKVLELLRNNSEQKPQQLADKLRDAEKRLAELRDQLAGLRNKVANTEKQPPSTTPQQLAQLDAKQQEIRRDIEKLTRQIERLQADDAAKATQSAANQLNNDTSKTNPPNPTEQRPSPSNQIQKAEEDLKQAADQLAQRRQQAEDDLALEFVRRFQAELTEMVARQQRVIKKTGELDGGRQGSAELNTEQGQAVAALAGEEQKLADKSKEHSELLFGLAPVRVSLEDAERRLLAASKLLSERQTGPPAQRAEQRALARLEGMLQAFAQTANEATPKPNAAPPPGGAGQNNQLPQKRPTFELLQVKMLRMLQADLNERTQQYQAQLAGANGADKAQLEQEAREIAAEQGRLAELVQNMLSRDNEKEPQ